MQLYYTSVATSNSAAWLVGDGIRPLKVKPAPCHKPEGRSDVVLIKVGAVAVNQLDVATQVTGSFFPKNVEYPRGPNWFGCRRRGWISWRFNRFLGCDVAGEVVQVGKPDLGGIRVGDRIVGLAVGGITPWDCWDSYAEAAFQEYVLVRRHLSFVIPETISYEQACVLPFTMTTAAYALFHEDYLYMCPPTIPPREPDDSSDVVIITDGISSEGCHAIQLASSAGYWVYSTAPPEYFKSVKALGAMRVFDNHSRHLADDIVSAIREDNRTIAGAVAVGSKTVDTCVRVLSKYKGGNGLRDNNKFIALIDVPENRRLHLDPITTARSFGSTVLRMSHTIRSKVSDVSVKLVMVQGLSDRKNAITRMVFRDFLPRALASGHITLAPQPKVVGTGLQKIQEGFNVLRKGVRNEKVVVSMQ